MHLPRGALACASALALTTPATAQAAVLYVSPSGSDRAAGTADAPLATPQRALALAQGGDTVLLAPGTYPGFRDTSVHAQSAARVGTRLTALDPESPPLVHGAQLLGAAYLAIDHVNFDAGILVGAHPTFRRYAREVSISEGRITSATGSTCVTLRNGVTAVTLRRNLITGCYTGVLGPGDGIADPAARPMASAIRVVGNTIEHIRSDGMQFGNWDDAVVEDNTIRDVNDPAGQIHNDAIQVLGNTHRLTVRGNVLEGSTQLLFAQGAIGPNDGLVATGNLLRRAKAYSVALSATSNIDFSHNTVWDSTYGVIFRTGSSGTWSHNVIDRYVPGEGTGTMADAGWNLTLRRTAGAPAPTDLVGVDPLFVDPAAGDFRLAPGSPALTLSAGAFL